MGVSNMTEQRTPEWFNQRKGRVTGSNVAAILGDDPYRAADDVLRAMVRDYHGVESEFPDNPAMAWGRANEANAIGLFELSTGLDVKKCGFFPYNDWLGASPDGLIGDDTILEFKCPYGIRNKPAPVPFKRLDQTHYYGQIQIEMLASGRTKAIFAQWTPHGEYVEHVKKDQAWLDFYLWELRSFYDLYLSELKNPEHLEPKRREINTPRLAQLIAEYDDMKEAQDRAKERIDEIMDAMQEAAGFKDALICGRKLTKVQKAGAISYAKAIKELLPKADLSPYTGAASSYWKFT
jgi:putative phage-type endonuclease